MRAMIGLLAIVAMFGSGLAAASHHEDYTAVTASEAGSIRGAACGYGVGAPVNFCASGTVHTKSFFNCIWSLGADTATGSSLGAGNTQKSTQPGCPCGASNQLIAVSCQGTATTVMQQQPE